MRVAFFPFRGNSSELHSRGGSSRRGGAFVPSGERKTMQRCVNPFQNSGAVAGPVQRDLIEKMVRGVPWMCVLDHGGYGLMKGDARFNIEKNVASCSIVWPRIPPMDRFINIPGHCVIQHELCKGCVESGLAYRTYSVCRMFPRRPKHHETSDSGTLDRHVEIPFQPSRVQRMYNGLDGKASVLFNTLAARSI